MNSCLSGSTRPRSASVCTLSEAERLTGIQLAPEHPQLSRGSHHRAAKPRRLWRGQEDSYLAEACSVSCPRSADAVPENDRDESRRRRAASSLFIAGRNSYVEAKLAKELSQL